MDNVALVTGGAGFIGSHLCRKLLNIGLDVICFDNFSPYIIRNTEDINDYTEKYDNVMYLLHDNHFRLVVGDLLDINSLEQVFKQYPIDYVFHFAAIAGVSDSFQNPIHYLDNNVKSTLNLLQVITSRVANVNEIVYASSSSVYGDRFDTTEDNRLTPMSVYGATKIACEALFHTYYEMLQIPTKMLRFFTVYGENQRPDMAIREFTRKIVNDEDITVYEDTLRDFTYIDDIINGIVGAFSIQTGLEAFNLGSGNSIRVRYMVETLSDIVQTHTGKTAHIIMKARPKGEAQSTLGNINKASEAFGYEPKTFIEEGLKKFVDWYLHGKKIMHLVS